MQELMVSISYLAVFLSIRIDDVDYVHGRLLDNFSYKVILEYRLIRKKPFKKMIIVGFQRNKNVQWKTELDQTF